MENTYETSSEAHSDTLTYEQARAELLATVQKLEAGNLPLEESLRLWERGEALADRCQSLLDGAQSRLEKVQAKRQAQADAAAEESTSEVASQE